MESKKKPNGDNAEYNNIYVLWLFQADQIILLFRALKCHIISWDFMVISNLWISARKM